MKNCVRSMVTATSILWRSNKTHSVMNAEGLAFRAEVSRQIWFLVFGFQRSGTSFTSTAPEPVTCFLHHIYLRLWRWELPEERYDVWWKVVRSAS